MTIEAAMTRAIVIALGADGAFFAVETDAAVAAVFRRLEGPVLRAGDIVSGEVTATGTQFLVHAEGVCMVVGETGPVQRTQALACVSQVDALR